MFYLVIKGIYGYKKLFTDKDLMLDEEFLDIYFIQKLKPLREYLGNYRQEEINYTVPFDIITTINIMVKTSVLENTKKGRKKS